MVTEIRDWFFLLSSRLPDCGRGFCLCPLTRTLGYESCGRFTNLMATIRVIYENGSLERLIEFDPAEAPFQHDGQPGSVLDVLLGHGIHLEHACGGNCACTTCHVVVRQGFNKLSEASEQEEDLLDRAPGLTPTSRLGCQAVIDDPEAEIVVVVPRYTINQVSESREG
jgi:ferredoxin, 2Fe-2S